VPRRLIAVKGEAELRRTTRAGCGAPATPAAITLGQRSSTLLFRENAV